MAVRAQERIGRDIYPALLTRPITCCACPFERLGVCERLSCFSLTSQAESDVHTRHERL